MTIIIKLTFCSFMIINWAYTQFSQPNLSFGILYADIETVGALDEWAVWRRGQWMAIETDLHVTKWFNLNLGLTYQERMPLEVLQFSTGSANTGRFVLKDYPTNPQNDMFDSKYFIRIPNFKYLSFEMVPMLTVGKRFHVRLGVGLFGSLLLNREQTTVSKEDLPQYAAVFGVPPLNLQGEVRYYKYDAGWIPKVALEYQCSKRFALGLVAKSYQSFIRLNDTFVESILDFNIRWVAYAGGIRINYTIQ